MTLKEKSITDQRNERIGEMCIGLHTALRKYCDSTVTSLAWNMVQVLPDKMWFKFGELVFSKLELLTDKKKPTQAQLTSALKDTVAYLDEGNFDTKEYGNIYFLRVLYLTFRLFSKEDWDVLTSIYNYIWIRGEDNVAG